MTTISSNIASSSEGPLAPTWISFTLEEHIQNLRLAVFKWVFYEDLLYDPCFESVAKVVEALRIDPCGDIDNLLFHIENPLKWLFIGSTPLHWAILMDDRVMVRYILSFGKVDINAQSEVIGSALSHAIFCKNHEIVEDLLEYKAQVFMDKAFHFMIHQRDSMFGIFKMILANNVNVCDGLKKTTLHYAVEEGYTNVVAYLLNEKADVNLNDNVGYTSIHYAAQKGSLEVMTLLLQQNADVNPVNRDGESPLHLAIKNGATNIILLLVDHNAIVDTLDKDGWSPLHLAAKTGATDIISFLLDHNAIVDILDRDGWSPLLHSLRCKSVDTFNALIAHGANVNVKVDEGNNALHLAIRDHGIDNNNMNIVKLLREHDVDANAKNSKGYSPFFAAVVEGHTEVVKELLRSKEKIKLMEECNGQTVIQIAFDNGHEHIKRVLLECDDVSRYVETLYRDRQVYVDAANAILVGAALIASVTFASWLQPPLGYTTSYFDLAPSSSDINYVDVQHNTSLRAFWMFNSFSFYFAIATVVFGARSVLPRRQMFIKNIVVQLHQNLLVTSILLACSVLCVIVAFGIAGCIVLTPILKFQWYMIVPTILGGLVCLVSLGFLFKSMVEDNIEKKRKTFQLYN